MPRRTAPARSSRSRRATRIPHASLPGIVNLGFVCFRLVEPGEQDVTFAFQRIHAPRTRMAVFAARAVPLAA